MCRKAHLTACQTADRGVRGAIKAGPNITDQGEPCKVQQMLVLSVPACCDQRLTAANVLTNYRITATTKTSTQTSVSSSSLRHLDTGWTCADNRTVNIVMANGVQLQTFCKLTKHPIYLPLKRWRVRQYMS